MSNFIEMNFSDGIAGSYSMLLLDWIVSTSFMYFPLN